MVLTTSKDEQSNVELFSNFWEGTSIVCWEGAYGHSSIIIMDAFSSSLAALDGGDSEH